MNPTLRYPVILLALAGLLLFVGAGIPASASILTLSNTTTVERIDSGMAVKVGLESRGDEAVHGLGVEAVFGASSLAGSKIASLSPGETASVTLVFSDSIPERGAWPVSVRMRYEDRNGYSFSAVAAAVFAAAPVSSPEALSGAMAGLEIVEKGELLLKISSAHGAPVRASARLLMPVELRSSTPEQELTIAANGYEEVRFPVEVFSGRPGSTLPVFAVVEYEVNGEHHAWFVRSTVEIRAPGSVVADHRPWIFVLIGILVFIFVFLQLRSRR